MDEEAQVEVVFSTIGNAAQLLYMVRAEDCAKSFRAQMDRAFITDPTLAQQVLWKKKDVDRKLRLLDAATAFVKEFIAVSQEVIAESEAQAEPQDISADAIALALKAVNDE